MSSATPSPELRRLLAAKLDTYEKLELVVVLSNRPALEDTCDELARELQVGADVLRRVAAELAKTGLVAVTDDTVRLTASEDERAAIGEGAHLEPRAVVRLLSSIALDRARGMAPRSFADAVLAPRAKRDDSDG